MIQLLKNNYGLLQEQYDELEKDRDRLNHEVGLFKADEHRHIADLRTSLANDRNNELQIKDIKEKIFKFLINERNKGADKIRVDFYKSIINLLMLAKDSEKDNSFNLNALMDYFTNEGKKEFGRNYVFHKKDRDDEFVQNAFEPKIDSNIRNSIRKLNKSDDNINENDDLHRVMNGDTNKWISPISSDDNTVYTDMLSNKSRKKGKKKTKMLEEKIKKLSEEITKLKVDVSVSQKKLKENPYPNNLSKSPRAISFSAISPINRQYTIKELGGSPTKLTHQMRLTDLSEDLLQYVHCLVQISEKD